MGTLILIDGDAPIDVSFVGLSSIFGASTSQSIPVSFGAAALGRKIVVALHATATSGNNPNLLSASIGGISASIPDGDLESPGVTFDNGIWWIVADVPSGTSGNVGMTFSSACAGRLAVWQMRNALSPTKVGSDALAFQTIGGSRTVNADVEGQGVFFGAATTLMLGGISITAGITTPDYNMPIAGSGDTMIAGGFELIPASAPGRAFTVTAGSSNTFEGAISAVSFR